jgi:divalent metal cation (Fe/Co/Zn/Cd) transporter
MTDQSEANIDDAVAIELGEQPAPVDPVEPASPSTWNGVKIDSTSFPVMDVHKKQPKTVRKFYKRQNRTVEELKAIQDKINIQRERFRKRNAETQLEENAQEENKIEKEERLTKAQAAYEKLCLASSFWVNVILALVKLGSSIVSLSLAVITSTFDSFLGSNNFISLTRTDLLVGAILYMANRMRNTKSPTMHMHYPVGRARLEPLGFIVFASVMSTASLFLIIEGAKQIIEGIIYKSRGQDIPENILSLSTNPAVLTAFYWVGVAVLAFTIVLKFILWLLCRRATYSTSCQAYATDHFLDVITNLVALVAVFVTQWVWWFDPMGAILLSIYIVYRWSKESIRKSIFAWY